MDTERLKATFAAAAAHGDEVPLFFYSHLFLTHPETRRMFPLSMAAQRERLVYALGQVVSDVDNLDRLVPFLKQLGGDHRKFAVEPAHYPAVGASLLATLEHFLGPEWTPDLAADWAAAYGLVSKVMSEAAEESAASTPAWWDAAVLSHEAHGLDVAVITVRPEGYLAYRAGQSLSVETEHCPRVWRYYSPANAPRLDGTIELHVRRVDGGAVSTALVQAAGVGDTLRLGQPVGHRLTLDLGSHRDLLLVAGGTGLAPLRALVEQVAREQPAGGAPRRVHLFVGARSPGEFYNVPALRGLVQEHPWLTVVPVAVNDPARGHSLAVGEAVLRYGPWPDHDIYVCGSEGMVADTVHRLVKAGYAEDAIRVEDFHSVGSPDRTPASGHEGGFFA